MLKSIKIRLGLIILKRKKFKEKKTKHFFMIAAQLISLNFNLFVLKKTKLTSFSKVSFKLKFEAI